jgi:type IV pilus assembly protein PilA
MSNNTKRGFSLIELLIVVAIILIIAAIAIPNFLRARMAANESSAAASVREIKTAELLYQGAFPTIGYAPNLADLGGAQPCTPSSTSACVVSDPLSTAGVGTLGKSGYVFSAVGSSTSGGVNDAFVVGSAPVTPNVTGIRLFCTTNDNAMRADPGPSSTPVTTVTACLNYAPL